MSATVGRGLGAEQITSASWWVQKLFPFPKGKRGSRRGRSTLCPSCPWGRLCPSLRWDGNGAQSCLRASERLFWGSVPPPPNLQNRAVVLCSWTTLKACMG